MNMKVARSTAMAVCCLAIGLSDLLGGRATPTHVGEDEVLNVIVYGSTPGAIMSAVSAARTFKYLGRTKWNVTLLDPEPRLGGMCSGGLGSTDKGNPVVIGGLAHEFFVRVAQTYDQNATEPLYYLEPHVAEQIFYDMLGEAGVSVLKYGRVASVARTSGPRLASVKMQNGISLGSSTSVFIDGSYEGDLMARAGISYTFGRESNTTYNESYGGRREPYKVGMDIAPINPLLPNRSLPSHHPLLTELYAAPLGSGDNKVQGYNFRLCVTQNQSNSVPFPKPDVYNRSDWELLFELAKSPRGDSLDLYLNNFGHPLPNGKHDLNNGGIISTDCTGCSWNYPDANYTERAKIVEHHKVYQQGYLYTLLTDMAIPEPVRKQLSSYGLCKDEFVSNNNWPEQLYIREARRMIGDFVFTQNDVDPENSYGNRSIGMGSYNFDAHYSHRGACIGDPSTGKCTMLTGPAPAGADIWLGGEGYCGGSVGTYEFPVELLYPKRSEALNFVNPVTPSTSHVSFATVRMEPQFMILGHASGAIAALALIENNGVTQTINTAHLHDVLVASHQTLSLAPVPPKHTSFGCIHGYCIQMDSGGGAGGNTSMCINTSCQDKTLAKKQWIIMGAHFGSPVPIGSGNIAITAKVDTHLKKSEVNSKFLPPNQIRPVSSGTTLVLTSMPVSIGDESYEIINCKTDDCAASVNRPRGTTPVRPNLVFILADDLEVTLGSPKSGLPQTQQLLASQGADFSTYFGHVPICCPGRASYLTGRYQHNTLTLQNSVQTGCNSAFWRQEVEPKAFAPLIQEAGYATFFGGKYLNAYGFQNAGGVQHIPPGWDTWIGLVGNSRYFGYTLSNQGVAEHHGNNYSVDYLTDLLANRSTAWVNEKLAEHSSQPLLVMVATPACHGPNDAAPKYRGRFANSSAPRTPNFGKLRKDGNSLISAQVEWDSDHAAWSDLVHRRRLQSLLSLDDLVVSLHSSFASANVLDRTVFFFTSDNGYHLGQFGIAFDKRTPYEQDIRLPLYVAGAGVPKATISVPTVSVDIAPTLLDLAGVGIPDFIDGRSFANLIGYESSQTSLPDRHDVLIEYWSQLTDSSESYKVAPGGPDGIPPEFTGGTFNVVFDTANNTFACLRTTIPLESLYCEYYPLAAGHGRNTSSGITPYVYEYYPLESDPWQLENGYANLSMTQRVSLSSRLAALKSCRGTSCNS